MTEPTNPNNDDLESRLRDYGAVLAGKLADSPDTGVGTVLLGDFGPALQARESAAHTKRPFVAMLSVAAAVVALALMLPTVLSPSETPVTVTGGDFAAQSEQPEGSASGGDNSPADEQNKAIETSEPDKTAETTGAGDNTASNNSASDNTASDNTASDNSASDNSASDDSDTFDELDEGDGPDKSADDWSAFTVAAAQGEKPAEDKPAEEKPTEEKPTDTEAKEDPSPSSGDAPDEDEEVTCEAGAEVRNGTCVIVGAPPTKASGSCPTGAVSLGDDCYEVVPASCGELATASDGHGCLKRVGPAGASSDGCPANYELTDDNTCVKLLAATATCTEGVAVDDSCLIKTEPTSDGVAGCGDGKLQIGNQCYELETPSMDCGSMPELAGGGCRSSVNAELTSACPDGFEGSPGFCYRYEAPPVVDCGSGTLQGDGMCKFIDAATPGPETCDVQALQDDQGCYVLVEPDEQGSCGELAEFQGACRKDKPSYPTWQCADGSTVTEPTCYVYESPTSVTCEAGEPVDNNTVCKNIVDAVTTESCPSYALEDSGGCYKVTDPTTSCGDLDVAPDGTNCKVWVGEADAAERTCPGGYELADNYCRKYVDGDVNCSGAELIYESGKAWCRYTQPASPADSATGCGAGEVERDATCYLVVSPSCGELDVDVYGNGCKKPIATDGDLTCEPGFALIDNECIKKL